MVTITGITRWVTFFVVSLAPRLPRRRQVQRIKESFCSEFNFVVMLKAISVMFRFTLPKSS